MVRFLKIQISFRAGYRLDWKRFLHIIYRRFLKLWDHLNVSVRLVVTICITIVA
jgi:hypothetical protein